MKSSYHLPVLLEESINGLKVYPKGVYVDATFGGGGHSYEILKNLSNEGSLISLIKIQIQSIILSTKLIFISSMKILNI